AGETHRLEVRVPVRIATTLHVLDEEGRPSADLGVRLRVLSGWSFYAFNGRSIDMDWQRVTAWSARTDAAGSAHIDLLAGRYEALVVRGAEQRRTTFEVGAEPAVVEVSWGVTLAARERRERDIVVPRVRGEGAEEPSVDMAAFVTEDGTGKALAGAEVYVQAVRGDLWISAGSIRTGSDGRATGRVIRG